MKKSTFCAFLLSLCFLCAAAPGRELPELNWQPGRSDWINVKTDVTPAAKGDGVADDTNAILAAIEKMDMRRDGKKTVYLPPGTYRITRTLSNEGKNDLSGFSLIGHGRSTTVLWDGEAGGVMFHSNGIHRSRFIGIIWDGNNKAHVAFDHRSQGRYETRIRHQHEAFRNVTGTGLRVGYEQKMASAEIWIENCLFENCKKAGMEYLAWNDYDNTVSGCGFYDCGTAVNVEKGNVYVRECHFENSTVADFAFCTHSHSVRRSTSLNSNAFVTSPQGGGTQEIVIEDCRVEGWKNKTGAIVTRLRGPLLVMDTVFTKPPAGASHIMLMAPARDLLQHLVYSNVTIPAGMTLVTPRPDNKITEVPPGKLGGAITDARQTFLRDTWSIPGKIFDVRSFGAKGNGKTDDTDAIEKALAAARAHGKGAMAYLPAGTFVVTRTLELTGSDYFFGGGGYCSILAWKGPENGGPVIRVKETKNVMLEQFQIGAPLAVCKIEHRGTGKPSWIGYDSVYVGGSFVKGDVPLRGLECYDLTPKDTIFAPHFDGSAKFVRSSTSNNLFSTSYDGVIEVSGKEKKGDGFIGFLSRANAGNPFDIVVKDSQSVVMSDYYTEQTQRFLHMTGSPDDEPGTVFIQAAKAGSDQADSFHIDNYKGMLYFGNAQFCYTSPDVKQKGENPVSLIFLGNMFWDRDPVFSLAPSARLILVENIAGGKLRNFIPNRFDANDLKTVADALDVSRKIGRRDLKFNYPHISVK